MNNLEELKAAATAMRLSSTVRITNEMITFRRLFTPDCTLALIAQLEAAQGIIKELESKVNHYVAAEYAHKHFDQTPDIIKRADSAELELVKVKAALSAAQLDATRWRALLSSPAIRILGHAGLQDDKPIDGHYCHFGMEIWSHYEPYYDNKKAGEVITRYADNMIAASLVEGNADAE